jgi:hypothetical protein
MHGLNVVFVSRVLSTGDIRHKMSRNLALGDATKTCFSLFLVRRPQTSFGEASGDALIRPK